MTDHSKPHGNMNASQLIALFEDTDRHPVALSFELMHCKLPVLVTLAYAEYAPLPHNAPVPERLSEMAYDEMERRDNAKARLLADCPALRATVA